MRVRVIDRTEEFIVLETSFRGMPSKITTVHIDAIINGQTTIEEQKALARADGNRRLARLNAMNAILGADNE